ncbi:MAG: PIG-L family deacetylase, partial [Anaerolineales bacterium]
MLLRKESAQIYIPDGSPVKEALARTTHLAIGAHQDDLEIMAIDGILRCFQQGDTWFTGVVVTNGAGSPRAGLYANYTDGEMRSARSMEQKKAAVVGEYSAQLLLDYSSKEVKDSSNDDVLSDLRSILQSANPEIVYTHNLADKHPTHVAISLRTTEAIRSLPGDDRPDHLYGCEVWRDLGWMLDEDKVVFDCTGHENLQMALLGIFDSQISGGKRYDLATMGRRSAHATYYASHDVDFSTG